MELFNTILDFLTTDFCVRKYGSIEDCQFQLKLILIGVPAAMLVGATISYFKRKKK